MTVVEACARALDAKAQTNSKAYTNIKKRRPMIPPRAILSRDSAAGNGFSWRLASGGNNRAEKFTFGLRRIAV
jgi:hypothetical protein